MAWRFVRPYKQPRRMPFVLEGNISYWEMPHNANLTCNNPYSFYTEPAGPTPQAFSIEDINCYLWPILWYLYNIEGPLTLGPAVGVGGGGREPHLGPPLP